MSYNLYTHVQMQYYIVLEKVVQLKAVRIRNKGYIYIGMCILYIYI